MTFIFFFLNWRLFCKTPLVMLHYSCEQTLTWEVTSMSKQTSVMPAVTLKAKPHDISLSLTAGLNTWYGIEVEKENIFREPIHRRPQHTEALSLTSQIYLPTKILCHLIEFTFDGGSSWALPLFFLLNFFSLSMGLTSCHFPPPMECVRKWPYEFETYCGLHCLG